VVSHNFHGSTSSEIAASIENAVHTRALGPGDSLPTVRELARTLKVSPTTVASAFRVLHARGIVTGRGRGGTRVALRPPTPAVTSRPVVPTGVVDLSTGNPDPSLLPPLDHALRAIDAVPRLYDGPPVLPALATFARGELRADGVPVSALTVTAGGLDAIDRVLREQLRPGDRVALEDPAFPGVLDLLAASGLTAVGVRTDDGGMLPGALDAALRGRVRAIVVTPRAQNPGGAAFTDERAGELRRLLDGHPDVLVIEDDHAGPVAGVPLVPLSDGTRPRWAFVRSVAKYLGPDLRLAVLAGDALTVARVEGRLSVGTRWVSHILQQLALVLWSDPSSARRLARAADVYRHRREALVAALASHGIEARGASGLNVWVPVPREADTVHALREAGWAVMPGERFRLRTPPGIRVTTAALLPEAAGRFAGDVARALARGGGSLA
jgi:DNA-binding transcriptional MocR family regulator